MAHPCGVIRSLPALSVYRKVEANDSALPTSKRAGLNCADFDEILVVASLKGGATAAIIEPHYFSDEESRFLPSLPAEQFSLSGQGQRFVLRVGHHGSVFFVVNAITGGSGERVVLEVGGIPVHGQKGS